MQDIFGAGLAFGSFFFIGIIPFALLALAIPYAVLRLRNEGPDDPQLGTKAGLQYFFSVSILVVLTGLTIMAVDLITREDPPRVPPQQQQFGQRPPVRPADNELFSAAQRTGLGMILSGLLGALAHFLLAVSLTNHENWTRVRRTFAGWRFAIHGMVVMFSGTTLVIMVLQKDAFEPVGFRIIKALFAILVLWIPAWMIQLGVLKWYGLAPRPDKHSFAPEAEVREENE